MSQAMEQSLAGTQDELSPIEVFPNQHRDRRYTIEVVCPEFTSVCPKTGLPDFGTLFIDYEPDEYCLELKAFKYYLLGYRNMGIFYENVVNKVLNDVIKAANPHWIEVRGEFQARGGINTNVIVKHEKKTD
jgi:7-cyano-7-deazaguanine reductase